MGAPTLAPSLPDVQQPVSAHSSAAIAGEDSRDSLAILRELALVPVELFVLGDGDVQHVASFVPYKQILRIGCVPVFLLPGDRQLPESYSERSRHQNGSGSAYPKSLPQ